MPDNLRQTKFTYEEHVRRMRAILNPPQVANTKPLLEKIRKVTQQRKMGVPPVGKG